MGRRQKADSRVGREGMALLAATLFIAVAVMILGALAMRVINQHNQVSQQSAFKDCFLGLESGFAESLVDLEQGGPGRIGLGTWTPTQTGVVELPSFDDPNVAPLTLPTMPSVSYMAYALEWISDGIDNNGNGVADDIGEDGYFTVYAFSRCGGIERAAEIVVAGQDVNVWRNAIFAGTGQAGGLVNGNVSIHGSVHLLGTDLPEGAEAIAALDLSGTSLIHNNYVGIPAPLLARVPALPQRQFNGETVSTLDAVLRVKNGLVSMSGNSEIGEPNVSGNAVKETLDGTRVNDGWTGTSVIDNGNRGIPKKVFSDDGWDHSYDLGNKVNLPMLADDWRTPTGETVLNPATGKNYTHEEYFHSVLTGTPYPGNLTIKANADFYYNATRPADTNIANRLPTDDYILFNATTNVMEINGQIEINGNLVITRGGGNDKTIYYTGRGAILVQGDATLDTDLLTVNKNGTTANSFPVNNFFGIMAKKNLIVGSLSQLQLMGGFYAQNMVKSSKQTITMGTFVGNYFDMGTNVPDIYQVPELPNNLPLGMIGNYPILNLSQVSWRELGGES